MHDPYPQLVRHLQLVQRLGGAMSLLGWDQEVTMPAGGARDRAGHRAALAGVIHEKLVDPALGTLLDAVAAEGAADPIVAANLREGRRLRDRALRLPAALVRDLAEATALAHGEWVQARRDDDWERFAPHLDRLVNLKRQEAALLAVSDDPYDSLLDAHEPGARSAAILPVFAALRGELTALLSRLGDRLADTGLPAGGVYPTAAQDQLNREICRRLGFAFEHGRLDTSAHPFTESLGQGDVRITTRYDEADPLSGLFSTLHEVGHALYEQGLPPGFNDTPAGQPASLGMHESQSRLWENFVGRGLPFCRWLAPQLAAACGGAFSDLTAERLFRAVNRVAPTPIRIEADEVTYNLHIILRLEVERLLFGGDLEPAGVPQVWREKAREYLGLDIADDRQGALQDIHWCMGAFGYFPTYTLGNLYAAMFWQAARNDLPQLDADLAEGRPGALLAWLRTRIHARGSVLVAGDLCREVTGQELDPAPFVAYLGDKYGALADL